MCARYLDIPFRRFIRTDVDKAFKTYLEDAKPDLVLVFGCGVKLPVTLFDIPKFGFYNVHFSLLPKYRGNAPVFWQIKNGEETGGITIHKMAEEYDTGPMLMQQPVVISAGENLGLYTTRLGAESAALISKAIEKLNTTGDSLLLEQDESAASHYPRVDADAMKIDWEKQSAKEIENLVNACNPENGGAITSLRGQPFRILEVNLAQLNAPGAYAPGTVVHSDMNYGVFVACRDAQYLRLNVIQIPEGIMSGFKLPALGIAAGERFENADQLIDVTIKP